MYNQLNQTYWVSKNGEKLNPYTDMSAEHIINVMNMLSDKAKKNDAKMNMLRDVLSFGEFTLMKNKMKSTDTITSDLLNETPLFKALGNGLKVALATGRIENQRNIKEKIKDDFLFWSEPTHPSHPDIIY